MMNKTKLFSSLYKIMCDSEILMDELEGERDEALENLRFEGEEEILTQHYRKTLTSVYRMRNNAAALLLRNECGCYDEGENLRIEMEDGCYSLSKQAIKNILQQEFDIIVKRNVDLQAVKPKKEVKPEVPEPAPAPEMEMGPVFDLDLEPVLEEEPSYEPAPEPEPVYEPAPEPVPEPLPVQEPELDMDSEIDFLNMQIGSNEPVKEEQAPEPEVKEPEPVEEENDEDRIRRELESMNADLFNAMLGMPGLDDFLSSFDSEPEPKAVPKEEPAAMKTDSVHEEPVTKEKPAAPFVSKDTKPASEKLVRPKAEPVVEEKKEDAFASVPEMKNPEPEKSDDGFDFDADLNFDAFLFDEPVKEELVKEPEPVQVPEPEPEPVKEDHEEENLFDLDFDIFSSDFDSPVEKEEKVPAPKAPEKKEAPPVVPKEEPKPVVQEVKEEKKEEEKKPAGRFNTNAFTPKREEPAKKKPDPKPIADTKPVFKTGFTSDDPDTILEKLKADRAKYDQEQLERMVEEANNADKNLEGTVFDLSTGSFKKGSVDIDEAINKIDRVADGIIQTAKKDKLMDIKMDMDMKADTDAYQIQSESDFTRKLENFILDVYKIKVQILDENDNVIKEEVSRLIVAPIVIPKSGTSMVTDICAYLESEKGGSGAVVSPGGKTTIVIRSDDYSVFVRGYWTKGEFTSAVSVAGNGCKIKHGIAKKELKPESAKGMGIGHNVLFLDHATTVHIIPLTFTNDFYDRARFMAIIIKDYGIDKDAECMITETEPEITIRGERFKYSVSCIWNEKELNVQSRIVK